MPRVLGSLSAAPPTPPLLTPSPQQQAALDFVSHGTGSAVLEAVAGAGKTTTLIQICSLLTGRAVFTAFNKKIADEIQRRLSAAAISPAQVRSATFHSIGFAAWRKVAPAARVDADKLDKLMEQLDFPFNQRAFCKAAVSLARQAMIFPGDGDMAWEILADHFDLHEKLLGADELSIPQGRLQAAIKRAQDLLDANIEQANQLIDFDDMIYMPLQAGAAFEQYEWVLVDEAQDTNTARRMMARRMLAPHGRLIAVGDRHQAIYGFTGADADALDLISKEFDCTQLPLTITYRCPKAVVALAQRWVSHIEADVTAPDGEVLNISEQQFRSQWTGKLLPDDAILCRNTKPLVELAFFLLRKRIACHVEGREIGQGLVNLIKRWKRPRTCGELWDQLETYLSQERNKFLAKPGGEAKAAALEDKLDTIQVFIEHVGLDAPIATLITEIHQMFHDSAGARRPDITLSTIHKAKGREWKRVFLLGRNRYMPSPFARQAWQREQEANLIYVAVTRVKQTLVEISVALPGQAASQPEPQEPTPLPPSPPLPVAAAKPAVNGLVNLLTTMHQISPAEARELIRQTLSQMESEE